MTDFGKLCERVYSKIEWQKFPTTYTDSDKEQMIADALIEAIQDLFVVTGRAFEYSNYEYIYETVVDEDGNESLSAIPSEFTYDLVLDEELYVLCAAQVTIFGKVRAQYNDLLGYTTNALTVTNADKPYAYISGTMSELENQKKVYFYKMVRYSHMG